MLHAFFQVGYERCMKDHGMVKTAQGWAPYAGALAGAILGPVILPHLGATNDRVNMALGALIGTGSALGWAESGRYWKDLAAEHQAMMPVFEANQRSALKRMTEIARQYKRI